MEKTIGISARRSLPHYASERFDKWFSRHCRASVSAPPRKGDLQIAPAVTNRRSLNRGHVILWDDTFVRYHEPHIGMAAVKVLEALGFEVSLVKNRRCCGRPAFSQGNLDAAAKLAKHNIISLSSRLSTLDRSNSLPRTLLLVDVCRRLPRAENRKRRKHRGTLFPVREIRGRFTGERTGGTSV